MQSPNNKGDRVPTGHLLLQNEAPNTRNGLYLIEVKKVKKVPQEYPNNTGYCQTIGCSPQTNIKVPLVKTISTQLSEHGEFELVPT